MMWLKLYPQVEELEKEMDSQQSTAGSVQTDLKSLQVGYTH